jgi:hypothetical protein
VLCTVVRVNKSHQTCDETGRSPQPLKTLPAIVSPGRSSFLLHSCTDLPKSCLRLPKCRTIQQQVNIKFLRSWEVSALDPASLFKMLTSLGGSFGVVYKAIERATGEIVAIKHVRMLLPFCAYIFLTSAD